MSLSFKKFMTFVNLEGDVSDEQINEIFGLFRNNKKIDDLKKQREKLKGMSADKKREIDQALKDFAAGKKTQVTDRVKGALKDVDWDDVLNADDRKFNARRDRLAMSSTNEAKAPTVKAFKIEIPQGLTDSAIWDFINDQSVVTIEDFERKGNIVYLYPHFEHDHDPHMGAVMQAAFNRYLKANHLD